MKLKKFNIKKYTMLKLYLTKHQTYKNKNLNFNNSIKDINLLQIQLKSILNLIYNYHFNNKRILFIGFPYTKQNKILQTLPHVFLSKNIWSNGLLSNKKKKTRTLFKNLFVNQKDPDLIVVFNISQNDIFLLKEVCTLGSPVLAIGNTAFFKSQNIINNITNTFSKKMLKQICSFLIYSVLKKKI